MAKEKRARNRAIVKAFKAGEGIRSLAERHGICQSNVHRLIRQYGAQLSPEARSERFRRHNIAMWADPVIRARIIAAKSKPRIFADDPVRREQYLTLQSYYGAAYAREQMGLAA